MNPYLKRIIRVQSLMEKQGIDAVIAVSTANFFYFTGTWIDPHERLLVCVIRKNEDPIILAPQMHEEDLISCTIETIFWKDGQDAIELLAKYLPDNGIISVDNLWSSYNLISLMKHKPSLEFVNSSGSLGVLRRIKDSVEIELLREAGIKADRVMREIMKKVVPGVKEIEVVEELKFLWKKEGVHDLAFLPIVGAGPNGAKPHHQSDETIIKAGDMVVIDMGGIVSYYCSDMTRTIAVGEVTPKMLEVYELVRNAQEAGVQAVKPGIPIGEIDRVTRDVIVKGGYGPNFVHRTGHGLGIEVHEEPYVYTGNDLIIETGMVFSIEPGIYLPGEFGIRIEDIVVATENGSERFNLFPRELFKV